MVIDKKFYRELSQHSESINSAFALAESSNRGLAVEAFKHSESINSAFALAESVNRGLAAEALKKHSESINSMAMLVQSPNRGLAAEAFKHSEFINSAAMLGQIITNGIGAVAFEHRESINSAFALAESLKRGLAAEVFKHRESINSAFALAESLNRGLAEQAFKHRESIHSAAMLAQTINNGLAAELSRYREPFLTITDTINAELSKHRGLVDTFTDPLLGEKVKQYLETIPITREEWLVAEHSLAEDIENDSLIIPSQQDLENSLASGQIDRSLFLKNLFIFITILILLVLVQEHPNNSNKNTQRISTILSIIGGLALSYSFDKLRRDWPAVQALWTNRSKAAPLAVVQFVFGKSVPVFKNANDKSPIIGYLGSGEVVPLSASKNRYMKRVVLEFDENGSPQKIGWVKSLDIKRISRKKSYEIKRYLSK